MAYRVLGIGVDILDTNRLVRLLNVHPWRPGKFASRILTATEISGMPDAQSSDLVPYLALRWSAKEALYKACYPHAQLTWGHAQIYKLNARKPTMDIIGPPEFLKETNPSVHLSVSNEGKYLVTMVVVEARRY